MTKRTEDKVLEIESYLNELGGILPSSFDEYKQSIKTRAACERYFEKITESVTDLAFIIIKERNLEIPSDEKQAFDVLCEHTIITKEVRTALKDARGMRNIIAHQYGKIDDKLVFEAVTSEISLDVQEFLKQVKKGVR